MNDFSQVKNVAVKVEKIFEDIEKMITNYLKEISNQLDDKPLKKNIQSALNTLSGIEKKQLHKAPDKLKPIIKKVMADFEMLKKDLERLDLHNQNQSLFSEITRIESEAETLLKNEIASL